jgi:hypothetical protein
MKKLVIAITATFIVALGVSIFIVMQVKGGSEMELITQKEFIEYLETNDTGYTAADFQDIDIDDLIQRLKLTESYFSSFIEEYGMASLIESYEKELAYQNAQLFTKEEFFEYLATHDTGLTVEDFEGIDIDDFIERSHLTKVPEIRHPQGVKDAFEKYQERQKL